MTTMENLEDNLELEPGRKHSVSSDSVASVMSPMAVHSPRPSVSSTSQNTCAGCAKWQKKLSRAEHKVTQFSLSFDELREKYDDAKIEKARLAATLRGIESKTQDHSRLFLNEKQEFEAKLMETKEALEISNTRQEHLHNRISELETSALLHDKTVEDLHNARISIRDIQDAMALQEKKHNSATVSAKDEVRNLNMQLVTIKHDNKRLLESQQNGRDLRQSTLLESDDFHAYLHRQVQKLNESTSHYRDFIMSQTDVLRESSDDFKARIKTLLRDRGDQDTAETDRHATTETEIPIIHADPTAPAPPVSALRARALSVPPAVSRKRASDCWRPEGGNDIDDSRGRKRVKEEPVPESSDPRRRAKSRHRR